MSVNEEEIVTESESKEMTSESKEVQPEVGQDQEHDEEQEVSPNESDSVAVVGKKKKNRRNRRKKNKNNVNSTDENQAENVQKSPEKVKNTPKGNDPKNPGDENKSGSKKTSAKKGDNNKKKGQNQQQQPQKVEQKQTSNQGQKTAETENQAENVQKSPEKAKNTPTKGNDPKNPGDGNKSGSKKKSANNKKKGQNANQNQQQQPQKVEQKQASNQGQKTAETENQASAKKAKKEDKNFPPLYTKEMIDKVFSEGNKTHLTRGVLRINPRNYKLAFVSSPDQCRPDILIPDVRNRNRALHMDEVVVDFLPEKDWKALPQKVEDYLALKKDLNDEDLRLKRIFERGNEAELTGFAMKHSQAKYFIQQTAKVVFIEAKKHSRKAAGKLELFPDKNPNYAKFVPKDSKVPRMKIPKKECPDGFFSRSEDFKKTLYVAKMVVWDQVATALGTLESDLGEDTDVDAVTKGILLEESIDDSDFHPNVKSCLPKLPFEIPQAEFRRRKDFRSECVFTIDPMTARDLDDALSVLRIGDDEFKIAVHIADVSYFVGHSTALDAAAADRATSVYLIDRVIPMLPRELCENLCSLNPDEERLTFSVEWIMNGKGEIKSEWFGRSVIKSCCKLAYEHAQSFIDQPDKVLT